MNMIEVEVNDTYAQDVDINLLQRAILNTLIQAGSAQEMDVTLLVEGDDILQQLNRQYLGRDYPTDVLSFEANDVDPETGRLHLGDIILSFPRAQEQRVSSGNSLADELQLLVVHGTLHLLGYDHDTPESKALMWEKQAAILKNLGCEIKSISGDED